MGRSPAEVAALFGEVVGAANVRAGDDAGDEVSHDECLTATAQQPLALVLPGTAEEVAAVLRVADEQRIPVTAHGAGTGLSGACIPQADGIVVAFDRMKRVVEVDEDNFVAVVEPGLRSTSSTPSWPTAASSTRCSPASTAPAWAATWRPTPAACGR